MSGDDYTVPENPVRLRFPGCDDRYCTDIEIRDDNIMEQIESFTVSLWRSEGTGNEIRLGPDEMEVIIVDDDGVFTYQLVTSAPTIIMYEVYSYLNYMHIILL